MDCSTPGFPDHHQFLELAPTHVYRVSDPFQHLILCSPLLLPPSIFPSIKDFSSELVLHIKWPKYWSFSFSIRPSMNIEDWFPLGLTSLILQSKGLSRVFSSTTVQKHQFFTAHPSLWTNSHINAWLLWKETTALTINTSKVLELQLQHQSFQWIFRVDFL